MERIHRLVRDSMQQSAHAVRTPHWQLTPIASSIACIAAGKLAFSTSSSAAALCTLANGASADDTMEWTSRAVCNIALVSQGKAQLQIPELQAALVHMARNARSDGAREWVSRAIMVGGHSRSVRILRPPRKSKTKTISVPRLWSRHGLSRTLPMTCRLHRWKA